MFETLSPPATDPILQVMGLFAADPRADKVDLGIGVYRSPEGATPIMAAVKAAEHQIWQTQDTKGYVALCGDPAFLDAMRRLILGDSVQAARVAACGTPGGTGALRQVFEMIQGLTPGATIWLSDPTWSNHPAIIDHLGLRQKTYRYYDRATGGIDRAGMMDDLGDVQAGDVILLHACCHNPTGADLSLQDWTDIADLCVTHGAIPFVDCAYLGFGEGLEADTTGMRLLARHVPEMLIAASCSKNFGLYRDRVGVAFVITAAGRAKDAAAGTMAGLNRGNFAFPPDHGARVVEAILHDPILRPQWEAELTEMRETMRANRRALANALRAETGSDRFGFFAAHNGMFSLCGATPEQVVTLRETYGVYVVGDGRLNVAGLTPDVIPQVAKALADTIR